MVGIFDRWFSKRPKGEDANLIIERSINEIQLLAESHQATWGFGNLDRWDVDLVEGKISFSSGDGFLATADVQVVGTYNTEDGTFLWAWDHPSIPESCAEASHLARAFGEEHGLADYTHRKIECDEATAWEYTAVTNHLAKLQGGYRGPSGSTYAFFVFGEVKLSKTEPDT